MRDRNTSSRPDLYEQLRRANRSAWRNDLADLVADMRASPALTATVFVIGFVAGAYVTVGLAFIWSLVQ